MTILCCLHVLRNQPYFQDIKDEVLLSLLRMAALSPRGDKDFQYLLGMMPEEESKSVDFNRLKTGLSFTWDIYVRIFCTGSLWSKVWHICLIQLLARARIIILFIFSTLCLLFTFWGRIQYQMNQFQELWNGYRGRIPIWTLKRFTRQWSPKLGMLTILIVPSIVQGYGGL